MAATDTLRAQLAACFRAHGELAGAPGTPAPAAIVAACFPSSAFAPATAGDTATGRWIVTDDLPPLVQQWPILEPLPPGYHEIPAETARRLILQPTLSFAPVSVQRSPAQTLVALSTGELATAGGAPRGPGRVPRAARAFRFPRAPRVPRPPRPPRAARAPRPPRSPRPPKPPRPPRPPRGARPSRHYTKYSVGWCKRPACNCWTPAGCIGPEMLEAVRLSGQLESIPDCYPGPCYDYVACVTHQCFSDVACAVRGIFQFWAREYRAAVAYVVPRVEAAAAQVTARRLLTLVPGPIQLVVGAGGAPIPPGALTQGCPEGQYWTVGLTGCSCQRPDTGRPPATADQLARCGIFLEGP